MVVLSFFRISLLYNTFLSVTENKEPMFFPFCSHGNKDVFSCRGILLAVSFFLERGHTDITVFVPSFRKEQPRPDMPITGKYKEVTSDILKALTTRQLYTEAENVLRGSKKSYTFFFMLV